MKTVPIDISVDSSKCFVCQRAEPLIQPGETRSIIGNPQCLFRADEAIPVDGVDYASFEIEAILVGMRHQFDPFVSNTLTLAPRRAVDVLAVLRRGSDLEDTASEAKRSKPSVSLDPCQAGIWITFRVKNISAQPQPFALTLRGMTTSNHVSDEAA